MAENPNPNGPGESVPSDSDPAGSPAGGAPANGPGEPGSAEGDPAKGPDGDDGALGDAGKKALKTERDARKAAEKDRDTALAEVKRLQRSNAAAKGTDLDAVKAEIRAEFQTQLAETAIKAEAKGRLQDPTDALLFIKATDVDPSDDAALVKAIDDLIKARPYLAKADGADGAKPWGDVGGGKTPSVTAEPASPEERMRRAYGSKASN